ncbi:GNAT family N-acetyltransferase [Pedobacter lithocola]|uniref:GNAT family N-acetyltransferase n=1 Tax=Pedobacter lithocola TaxID=1908239 RepID=A0ABV8PB14_9SPHI
MKRAVKKDKVLVINILAKAFDDNQSVNYIVRQDDNREKRIRALMDYSFEVCNRFGEIWLGDDRKSCALILYPHQKKITLVTVWLDIKLVCQALGLSGILKALDRESKIQEKQPKEKMLYIWFIAVDPLCHKQGIGSLLLQHLNARAQSIGLSVYLETSTPRNLPWYERYGFQIYDSLKLDYTLYFLKRSTS